MSVLRCIVVILAIFLCVYSSTSASEQLKAGMAFVDITAPIPFRMHGYFYERLSTGIKDPLYARAIVFQQGKESAAFVFCDLVGIPYAETAPARKKANAATGIPVEHIAVTGTHTHTGPQFFMSLNDYFHERAVAKHGKDPYDSAAYQAELINKIADAVVRAKAALEPVELKGGFAHEDRVSFNRRYRMKGGAVRLIRRSASSRLPKLVRQSHRLSSFRSQCTLTRRAAARCIRLTIFMGSM